MKKEKKFTFYFLIFFFIFILINIFSFITIKLITKKNIYSDEYIEFKKRFRKSEFKTIYPHPFFGFSTKDNASYEYFFNTEPIFVNNPNQNLNTNKQIKILILGGSVAKHLSLNNSNDIVNYKNKEILNNEIFENTLNYYFNTNRFNIFNGSIDGGKQPQQLFKLYYLDLANLEFDLILNLDGFNELALPLSENYEINDHLVYPRNYSRLISTFNSNFDCVKNLNNKVNRFLYLPIFEIIDLYSIRNCHFSLEGQNKNSGTRFSKMTNYEKNNFNKTLEKTLNLWKISSDKIFNYAEEKKIIYIHALQPNQYLLNSKILTEKEKKLLNYPKYGNIISKYYNQLNLENLKAKNLIDLRYLFKNNSKDLYRDYCCHLNNLGMHLISLEIIKNFEKEFQSLIK